MKFDCLIPSGRFTLSVNINFIRDIFLIAGGSGISPLFSHLKNIIKNEPQSKVVLIYANKNESTVIFKNQIEKLQILHPEQLKIINLYSAPSEKAHLTPVRLNNFLLQKLINENISFQKQDAQFLICGPSELIRMAQITLHFMGFVDEQIKKENYVIIPVRQRINAHSKSRKITIKLRGIIYTLNVPPDKYILQAALENSIDLPYSCKGGRCSSCTCILISGKVSMAINDVLTDKDIENGMILTCTAQPESDDVMIEVL